MAANTYPKMQIHFIAFTNGHMASRVLLYTKQPLDGLEANLIGISGKVDRCDRRVDGAIEDLAGAVPAVRHHDAIKSGKEGYTWDSSRPQAL